MTPTWLTAFIDLPADRYDAGAAFWCGVTGSDVSPSRGDHDEFATLVPPDGDPYLRVQRTVDGTSGIHLDLHHPDQEFRVLRSPAGVVYCEVSADLRHRPHPAYWPGGHRSLVDQVCLDIPAARFDDECAFWADRTGWQLIDFPGKPEFRALERPEGQPLRFLLQRLDDEQPQATAHFDVGTDDRAAETARHESLGAELVSRHDWWTVLRDPAGSAYCITDRDPETGVLVSPSAN